jgi:hypothetical protein
MRLTAPLQSLAALGLLACGGASPQATPSAIPPSSGERDTTPTPDPTSVDPAPQADDPVPVTPGEGMRVERNQVFPPTDWIPEHRALSAILAEVGAPSIQESCTDLTCSFIAYFADRTRERRTIARLRDAGYAIDEGLGNEVRDLQIDYLPGSHLGINLQTSRRDLATFARVLGQAGPAQALRAVLDDEPRTAHYARDPAYEEACISWSVTAPARNRALAWGRAQDLTREPSGNGDRFRGTSDGYDIVFFVGGQDRSSDRHLVELCTSRET